MAGIRDRRALGRVMPLAALADDRAPAETACAALRATICGAHGKPPFPYNSPEARSELMLFAMPLKHVPRLDDGCPVHAR